MSPLTYDARNTAFWADTSLQLHNPIEDGRALWSEATSIGRKISLFSLFDDDAQQNPNSNERVYHGQKPVLKIGSDDRMRIIT
jgi:hypothetical protein